MGPELSIIVPIYNVENYLEDCIESILLQTITNFEVILVNDGSQDNSGNICDYFAQKDKRIKVIHMEKNKGVSAARNIGISSSSSEFIAFVDPDDTIEPNMYEILLNYAKEFNTDIGICPIRTTNYITNLISVSTVWEKTNSPINKKELENEIIPSVLSKGFYSILSCCNKVYRRKCFSYVIFDESRQHGEDARLNLLLLTKIDSVVFVDQPLYNYFVRKRESLTQIFRDDLYRYILDNKNFGVFMCQKYKVTGVIEKYISDFLLKTLNYMQDAVENTKLSKNTKRKIIIEIMNDEEFQKNIISFKSSSVYFTILKKICISKNCLLFIKTVEGKIKLRKYIRWVGI